MEFVKEPKRKRHVYVTRDQPFPVVIECVSGIPVSERLWQTYTGRYNGDCVAVEKDSDAYSLYTKGFFGKGSLSKNFPTFGRYKNGIPPFISERQWKHRNKWKEDLEAEDLETTNGISVKAEHNKDYVIKEEVHSDADFSSSGLVHTADGLVREQGPQVFPPDWQSEQKDTDSTETVSTPYRTPTIRFRRDPPNKRSTAARSLSENTSSDNRTEDKVLPSDRQVVGVSSRIGSEYTAATEGSSAAKQMSQTSRTDVERCNTSDMGETEKRGQLAADENIRMCQGIANEVVVLRDSDSEEEELMIDKLEARLVQNPYALPEQLHLTLEEAFFLSYALGCLQVLDLAGKVMTLRDVWETFRASDIEFVQKYVAYHHFRTKGWVVRSGLKYGGDFLLYKEGPPFYHASYIVLVEVLRQADCSRSSPHNRRSITWPLLFGANRLAETVAKEILMCRVIWPSSVADYGPNTPTQLARFSVQEVLLKRWVSSQEREELDREDIIE